MNFEQEHLKLKYEHGDAKTYKRLCPICGETFYTRQPSKKYCSTGMIYFIDGGKYTDRGCKSKAAQQRRKENRAKAIRACVCLQCGAPFTAGREGAGYCSNACRQAAYRQRALQINSNRNTEGVE